jgi:hypothetical protein
MFICIFTRSIYGVSGNELSPPITGGGSYSYLSGEKETLVEFKARMQELGNLIRARAASQPVRPYSWHDGWDWRISEVRTLDDVYPT